MLISLTEFLYVYFIKEVKHLTLTLMATSMARLMFSVHTLPASPYIELLAIVIASLAVLNGRATNTGPNI